MEIIKKVLMVLGAVFICFLLIGGSVIAYMAVRGNGLDQSSKEYVDENVPLIISSWSQEELLKRASPRLIKVLQDKPGDLSKLFTDSARALGPLQRYKGCQGQARMSAHADQQMLHSSQGMEVTAEYVAEATFEHGDAQISVTLEQSSGRWQIIGFHVKSLRPAHPAASPVPTP